METNQETQIPCAKCQSYNAERRKFSCKPHICKELSAWLLKHVPQLAPNPNKIEWHLQETIIPYVV
ncbi:MAG: hypothetical protein ACLQO7_00650 [Candidatus Bathyarchaeia archaeon]